MAKWQKAGAPPYGLECDEDGNLFLCVAEALTISYIKELQSKGMTLTDIASLLNTEAAADKVALPRAASNAKASDQWTRHSVKKALDSYPEGLKIRV